jgi:glycosyltransferase involved in cell wall biosynthesis
LIKVLLISFVQPFPTDDGKKVVLQGLVRYFLARSDTRVDYIVLGGAGVDETAQERLTLHYLSGRPRRHQLLAALIRSIIQRRPLQQGLLYSERLRAALSRQIAALEPDLIIYDTIRVSQFVENPRAVAATAKQIFYMDDLHSVRYEGMLRAMARYPGLRLEPLGNFAKHLPRICRAIANRPFLCRYLLERERQLVKEVEIVEAMKFDLSVLVNRAEAALLGERSATANIATMPIALPEHGRSLPVRNYQGRPDFVFLGALNVAHNQASIEYFIANIFPECLLRMPDMKFRVIGQMPPEQLRKLFALYPRTIEWTEWVADVGEVFAECSAMLVPLLFGSGVKVKTLEALRCGLPVISTAFGAEGITADDSEQTSGIVVENDLQQFPRHMQSLLDPASNDRLSRQAREYYLASYGAQARARKYDALFGLDDPARRQ